jgi:hypothetical protein
MMEEKHAMRVLFFHHGKNAHDHGLRPRKPAAVVAGPRCAKRANRLIRRQLTFS